jgi:glycosyltransferase involved in cell wall biosynthesis
MLGSAQTPLGSDRIPDVTVIMPCLNEVVSLPHCIANARAALAQLELRYGLSGEILIADNGSEDGSREIAMRSGVRVISILEKGYGAALIGGCRAASGRFLLMGDADGSYDFTDGIAMIGKLLAGADLCMGSRFAGGIEAGAMPWKNRHIGNPLLTGVLNLLFRACIDDAHCGLRALTKPCFARLKLRGSGMEFASEMVIKATLLHERIANVPVTLHRDLRGRPPHLRPWRDGWRHLRYLMMLSPAGIFAAPAAIGIILSVAILASAGVMQLTSHEWTGSHFGNYWTILAGSVLSISHVAGIFALACHLYGIREGYRLPSRATAILSRWISLESMLAAGLGAILVGIGILIALVAYWSANDYARIGSVLPAVLGTSLLAIGIQNIFGGFLLAVVGGNEARFLRSFARQSVTDDESWRQPAPATPSAAEIKV